MEENYIMSYFFLLQFKDMAVLCRESITLWSAQSTPKPALAQKHIHSPQHSPNVYHLIFQEGLRRPAIALASSFLYDPHAYSYILIYPMQNQAKDQMLALK